MTTVQAHQLFRTFDDYVPLLSHRQEPVCSWALKRVENQYPWCFGEAVPQVLEDAAPSSHSLLCMGG